MITLLNPEMLIICGEGTDFGPDYLDPVVSSVREQTFADVGRTLEIKIQRWVMKPGRWARPRSCCANRSAHQSLKKAITQYGIVRQHEIWVVSQ